MAFSSEITQRAVAVGNKRMSMGTYSASSATGGNINTGLRSCEHIQLMPVNSALSSTLPPAVNETLPVAGSAVTIVTDSGATGNWIAWGY
jgi:hypothetical protein